MVWASACYPHAMFRPRTLAADTFSVTILDHPGFTAKGCPQGHASEDVSPHRIVPHIGTETCVIGPEAYMYSVLLPFRQREATCQE